MKDNEDARWVSRKECIVKRHIKTSSCQALTPRCLLCSLDLNSSEQGEVSQKQALGFSVERRAESYNIEAQEFMPK